ncbi:LOW QUALITY PROTEIN: neprilysin-11 [Drosophila elegans]|uniref:LOW QUALITY PROTEIN: neprilysin-11 n=1 Tax=Drosophila elegans TaxID=30023 RepID=UPI0007E75B24|nr:LOW QUALITY PROTEIN: neprilysin-11 [Drosophila elegans]
MWVICLLFAPIVAASYNTRLLNNILSYVDDDSNACGHFYNHVCGKYNVRHMDDSFYDIIQMLDHQVNQNFVKLMEELELRQSFQSPGFNESSVQAKVLRFYLSCRETQRNMSSLEQYLNLASPGEGLTWPQFTPNGRTWPQKPFKWLETVAYLHRYGLNHVFLNLDVILNPHNASEYRLEIRKPSFAEDSQHLHSFVETLAILYILKVPSTEIVPLARKIRNLEFDIKMLAKEYDFVESGLFSVKQLESRTGHNWQRFFEITVGHSITPEFRVLAQHLRYFTSLKNLMDKQQDAQVVASYIMTRFALYILQDTEDSKEPIACITDVRRSMNLAANLLYRERFLETSNLNTYIHEINNIFEQLRRQFLLQVEHNRLELTDTQKRYIARKAESIILNIGNFPITDDLHNFVSRHYKELEFSSGDLDFHRDHLKLLQFRIRKIMAQSIKVHQDEKNILTYPNQAWPYPPTQPFFVPDSDDVFKYSLMGFTLAHQLMNAFDTSGITVDSNGNDQKFKSQRFDEAVECMYRNGTRNIDERIVDKGGLELAYTTYSKNGKNRIDFTHLQPEKIFFLSLGQFFCGNSDFNAEYKDDQERLQQLLNGFEPFDEVFGCRRNGPQLEKCQLW